MSSSQIQLNLEGENVLVVLTVDGLTHNYASEDSWYIFNRFP